jgi:hypothetical protein
MGGAGQLLIEVPIVVGHVLRVAVNFIHRPRGAISAPRVVHSLGHQHIGLLARGYLLTSAINCALASAAQLHIEVSHSAPT